MKFILVALVIFSSFSVLADSYTDGREAVKALMSENPVTTNGDKVSDYIAASMLSDLGSNGGSLSVVTASCQPSFTGVTFDCRLDIQNSDRVITKDGAYAEAEGMTESSTSIVFSISVDPSSKAVKIVGSVEVLQAG